MDKNKLINEFDDWAEYNIDNYLSKHDCEKIIDFILSKIQNNYTCTNPIIRGIEPDTYCLNCKNKQHEPNNSQN